MKKIYKQKNSSLIHFSQWKRKSYSLFQVIGKTVRIGVLTIAYLTVANPSEAQEKTTRTQSGDTVDITIEEVEVKGQRISAGLTEMARLVTVITQKEIAQSPCSSIHDFLDQNLSIDIRQRGPLGVQADITIRSSTYEQVLILINGVPFNDPQSGHFNGDIPVPLQAVKRIELIDGGASRWLGPNAFAGAINIITKTESKEKLKIQFLTGQHKYLKCETLTSLKTKDWNHVISGSWTKTDGYIDNTDLNDWKVYYSGQIKKDKILVSGQAGLGSKKFGAQTFYTPVYPDQYEEVGSSFISAGWKKTGELNISQDAYLKFHLDEFHLFRESGPSWYSGPNHHLTRVIGLINNIWWNNRIGRSTLGIDYRNESIWSTVLGFPIEDGMHIPGDPEQRYNHSAMRQYISLYGEQSWAVKRLKVVVGLLGQIHFADTLGFNLFPGVDMKYRTGDYSHIFSSVNRSLRNPTFTELYYSSPTNQGNPLLQPESAWSSQIGYQVSLKSTSFRTYLYGSSSKNNIDWSKAQGEDKWLSRNINEMFQMGVEFRGSIKPISKGPLKLSKLTFGYRYGYVSKSSGGFDSKYVLDYLQHKAILSGFIPIYRNIALTIQTSYQDRAGDYTDWDENGLSYQHEYDPFLLVDIKVGYKIRNGNIFLDISNLLDQEHADIGIIRQPGRWIRFGCNLSLFREDNSYL